MRWDERRHAGRLTGLLVAAVLALLAPLVLATPAHAHASLISADPADGSKLDSPPRSVTLTFSEPLLVPTVAVAVVDAAGMRYDVATPVVDRQVVTIPWPAAATAGDFNVGYRVVSQDGHPIEGIVRLSIEDKAAATPAASTPSADATPDDATNATSPVPAETTASDAENAANPSIAPVVGVGIVAVLVAVFALLIVNKRKQS